MPKRKKPAVPENPKSSKATSKPFSKTEPAPVIIYHPMARREYDRQVALLMRNPFTTRVVANFIEEIESAEKAILRDPHQFPVVRGKSQYRRFGPTKIYRFLIIYEIVGSDIYVFAIVHPSRRPRYWIKRRIS